MSTILPILKAFDGVAPVSPQWLQKQMDLGTNVFTRKHGGIASLTFRGIVELNGIGTLPRPEEGEEEVLPAMADDDYLTQLSWQSESKDMNQVEVCIK